MYACYIDESGHCGTKFNVAQPVEVVCGVITDVTKLFKTKREHNNLLKVLDKNNIKVTELKAQEIYRGGKQWHNIDYKIRDKVIEALLNWADERSCKYLVCPIDSKKFFDRKNNGCVYANKLVYPYEAGVINTVLGIQRLKNGIKKNKGKTFVILDEQHGHNGNVIKLLDGDISYTDEYTGYIPKPKSKNQSERLSEIVDIPFFSKSHLSNLIQISDLTAFIVNKYLMLKVYGTPESYQGEFAKIEKWYEMIGLNLIPHTSINPVAKNGFCDFYREVRPDGWSIKKWKV